MGEGERVRIVPAREEHLKEIAEIYNEAVLRSTATFDEESKSLEEKQAWLKVHGGSYPVFVALLGQDVVGWGSLSHHSDRCGYRHTVEDSIYVKEGFRGRGIGRLLLERLVSEARRAGHHAIVARIDAGNEISLRMHRSMGFEEVGRLREVGFKFGDWLDVVLMEILI